MKLQQKFTAKILRKIIVTHLLHKKNFKNISSAGELPISKISYSSFSDRSFSSSIRLTDAVFKILKSRKLVLSENPQHDMNFISI